MMNPLGLITENIKICWIKILKSMKRVIFLYITLWQTSWETTDVDNNLCKKNLFAWIQ